MDRNHRLIVAPYEKARVTLVGCGGTGSHLAAAAARLAHVLRENRIHMTGWFIDPDQVTPMNIGRQNFCAADAGRPKAAALAERYGLAYGWPVEWTRARYKDRGADQTGGRLDIEVIIGAVDSATARREIAADLGPWNHRAKRTFWLDCGNDRSSGQVLLGTHRRDRISGRTDTAAPILDRMGLCHELPLPSEQHPELVKRGRAQIRPVSCAEYVGAGEQDLFVNQTVAAIAAAYLSDILLKREITRFATYFDLESRGMRSLPIRPGHLRKWLGEPVETGKLAEAA